LADLPGTSVERKVGCAGGSPCYTTTPFSAAFRRSGDHHTVLDIEAADLGEGSSGYVVVGIELRNDAEE
jgi:hypothetical protein